MPPSFIRRGEWRAWLASFVVILLVGSPLLAILHQGWVRHAVCEHGDLIELDHSRAESTLEPAGAPSDSNSAALDVESSASVHSHNHCSVSALAKSGGLGVISRSCDVLHVVWSSAYDLPIGDVVAAGSVLVNAPKTSPPVPRRLSIFA
jgi:hypothetical protein